MSTIPDKTVFDGKIADNLDETVSTYVRRPVLITLDGTDVNRRYRIDRKEMSLGRDLMCDITLNDIKCSRHHARITYVNFDQPEETPEIILNDLKSTNGSFINGERINEHKLKDRDKILFGSTLMGFCLRDDSELKADQELYMMASCDALTGLRNRGVFNMELQREFDRSRRYSRSLSLVMCDIDHFKTFNDTYGHQMGDFVLKELGKLVRANIRSNDVGCRYGGEEFAIILPETSLEGAMIQAERLRISVNHHSFQRDSTSLNISISVGIAMVESTMHRMEDLISATDKCLYQSKAEGRNCTSYWRRGKIYSASTITN